MENQRIFFTMEYCVKLPRGIYFKVQSHYKKVNDNQVKVNKTIK